MWFINQTSKSQRHALKAAFGGYALDGFDYMLYTFLIPSLMSAWAMTKAEAGFIATGALLTSALGGWIAGILADRYGRVRVLQWTVLWFAAFTGLSGFTQSYEQLFFTRAMQGFGMGGEWAVGSVLIAESISAQLRGRAAGLVQSSWAVGWAMAAVLFWICAATLPAVIAWRVMFWIGVVPAIFVIYIRRHVTEPLVYTETQQRSSTRPWQFLQIFNRRYLKMTLLASLLATGMQGAYYAVTTWLPTYLKTDRQLSVLGTSGYLLILILGSFIGYLSSGSLADRVGRRLNFMVFALLGAAMVLSYTQLPITNEWMLWLGFPLGFCLSGIFSGMGAYLAELFPNEIRGSAQGFCYNVGRALGAICPAYIGVLSTHGAPLGQTLGWVAAVCYGLVIGMAMLLPETRAQALK